MGKLFQVSCDYMARAMFGSCVLVGTDFESTFVLFFPFFS